MRVRFERSFYRDLKRIRSRRVRRQILQVIEEVKKAARPSDIPHLRKLEGGETYYRIRVGAYRLGIEIMEGEVIFVRCLHRRDLYRYFP